MEKEFVAEKYIQQFDEFDVSLKDKIIKYVNLNDERLTEHLSRIHYDLWNNYRILTGTSAGFHGIDEHIVFLAIKCFIEKQNDLQKFKIKKVESRTYLCSVEIGNNNKKLLIYRSSRLSHFPAEAREQLFIKDIKLRAPDIAILKKDGDTYTMIAAIEIKNYLDKSATNSAIGMLTQIRNASQGNNTNTKYALFSFDGIYVGDKIAKNLEEFLNDENSCIIVTKGNTRKSNEKYNMFKVVDLSQFFDMIKKDIEL
jgi:hypothetical protein